MNRLPKLLAFSMTRVQCTFQANDDQTAFWGAKDTTLLRPKSKGAGKMVSKLIDEHNGYIKLTNKE
jgi:hypothetical protein